MSTTTQMQKSEIESTVTREFSLIDGEFTQEEAREILIHLISYKIKFHNQKIFSISERYGEKDEKSMKRIVQLTKTMDELKEMLDELKSDDHLDVTSTIQVTKK